ncbi:MAG: FAD-binding oxidoreductase [Gallionellaceae bacterium]|nr:FAD-binding oxidoreductase [Gallionellaceae bacterium]
MSDIEFEQGVNETTEAIVQASTRITPESTAEVRQIVLRVNEPAFYFLEGQSIGVLVPGPHPFGNKSHHRYYTIANAKGDDSGVELELLVRRCFYIDEVSGEEYPGIASQLLCNARVGDRITLTGPYRSPFRIPADKNSNLLMLGTGTGIAPFRAFLRRVYEERNDWGGKVRLYFGARTGTDLLYMNDLNNDLANYYDQKTFQAIQSLSKGVLSDAADALRDGVEAHAEEVWDLVCSPNTHVYLAGMKKAADQFNTGMAKLAGSDEQWQVIKQGLVDDRRWSELTYI